MPGFDAVVTFRCHRSLTLRLARLAEKARRDLPNLLRLITEDYAAAEEDRLKLPPITAHEVQEYLMAAEKKDSPPVPASKPVRYRLTRRSRNAKGTS